MRGIKSRRKGLILLCLMMTGLIFGGCGKEKAEYEMKISGEVKEPGVLTFLGMDVNAYQDQAGNPCGDCTMQPTHLFVGDQPDRIVIAIRDAVERADDLWAVKEYDEDSIVLIEKTEGSVKECEAPTTPAGVKIQARVLKGDLAVVSGDGQSGADAQELENTAEEFGDPQRIAAVYGPSYEALTVLGVEDRIVVRADVQTDDFPWAEKVFKRITEVPALDNVHTSVNFEELMNYDPQIVFAFPRTNELTQLEKAGIPAVAGASAKKPQDVKVQLMKYAKALNQEAVERAEAYGKYFDEKFQYVTDITGKIKEEDRPRVYYAGVDVLTTYGKYSDIPELIRAAGGKPVSGNLKAGSRTQIDKEQFLEWNPEYIFIDHGGMNDGKNVEEIREDIYKDKNYKNIEAVKNKNIYLSPSGVFYWDMGLQKILLLMNVARILHPEEFSQLDMEYEVMDFYERFYDYPLTREEAGKILQREF